MALTQIRDIAFVKTEPQNKYNLWLHFKEKKALVLEMWVNGTWREVNSFWGTKGNVDPEPGPSPSPTPSGDSLPILYIHPESTDAYTHNIEVIENWITTYGNKGTASAILEGSFNIESVNFGTELIVNIVWNVSSDNTNIAWEGLLESYIITGTIERSTGIIPYTNINMIDLLEHQDNIPIIYTNGYVQDWQQVNMQTLHNIQNSNIAIVKLIGELNGISGECFGTWYNNSNDTSIQENCGLIVLSTIKNKIFVLTINKETGYIVDSQTFDLEGITTDISTLQTNYTQLNTRVGNIENTGDAYKIQQIKDFLDEHEIMDQYSMPVFASNHYDLKEMFTSFSGMIYDAIAEVLSQCLDQIGLIYDGKYMVKTFKNHYSTEDNMQEWCIACTSRSDLFSLLILDEINTAVAPDTNSHTWILRDADVLMKISSEIVSNGYDNQVI